MQGVQTKKVLGYVFLPRVIPRAKNLFASGFGYLAFLMANIYNIVKLLPANHPYLNPENIGFFGIRHVIGEAANNLVLSRKNIDQIVIFLALLAGVIILGLQIVLLLYKAIIEPAVAQTALNSIFSISQEQARNDIAFMMLDRVFGIPNFFKSCVSLAGAVCSPGDPPSPTLPTPFHLGLHSMFRFYSMGLLFVGSLIFLYFVVIVIGETAVTGTPFGQRFQNVWVPIRLVVALGLLLPISHGLNSGQYITLYAAKIGSNFATNGWLRFHNVGNGELNNDSQSSANLLGQEDSLIAKPNTPDISPTLNFMSLVHACAYGYWHLDNNKTPVSGEQVTFYESPYDYTSPNDQINKGVQAYLIKPSSEANEEVFRLLNDTSYEQAVEFYNGANTKDLRNIKITFGVKNEDKYGEYPAKIHPTCGSITVAVNTLSDLVAGPVEVQKYYYDMIVNLWQLGLVAGNNDFVTLSQRFMAYNLPNKFWYRPQPDGSQYIVACTICGSSLDLACFTWGSISLPLCVLEPHISVASRLITQHQAELATKINEAWVAFNTSPGTFSEGQDITKYGWGGAGIWYNTISQMNGAFIDAVTIIPRPTEFPAIMEKVKDARGANDANVEAKEQYELDMSGEKSLELKDDRLGGDAKDLARSLSKYYNYWLSAQESAMGENNPTGSIFVDAINLLFGTGGLVAIRGENANMHPMAQLSAVGKSLVDSAVINVLGSVTGMIKTVISGASKGNEGLGEAVTGLATQLAFVGLTAGFVLFYILPFLPFLYFFFAVGSWVKSIFEAMVGVPLWALAHLRIDGEGLPGDSASNGYFLIFEIFLRPILTVFALIASTLIFTAQVRILNFIWDLVVVNLTGHAGDYDNVIIDIMSIKLTRDPIDNFFFTIVYTVVVYMMATASFKLIDNIPDNILRWLGAGVSSFSDINEDSIKEITRIGSVGGLTFGRQLTQSAKQVGDGVSKAITDELSGLENIIADRFKDFNGKPK